MPTIYTFHRADDNAILATAEPGNLQQVAAKVATALSHAARSGALRKPSRAAYVHNGRGVIAAGHCDGGRWLDRKREPYANRDDAARTARAAAGWPNDPKK